MPLVMVKRPCVRHGATKNKQREYLYVLYTSHKTKAKKRGKVWAWVSYTKFRETVGPQPLGTVLTHVDQTKPHGPGNVAWLPRPPRSPIRFRGVRESTTEYRIWCAMRQRCVNPKSPAYKYYGARGVRVCDRWSSFEAFFEDMGTRPEGTSLDRRNNDGNYEPGNCRWSDRFTQARNRRCSVNITSGGVTMTRDEWARKLGVSKKTLATRTKQMGWPLEKAVTTPVKHKDQSWRNRGVRK